MRNMLLTVLLGWLLLANATGAAAAELNIYIWSEYLPDSVIEKFMQKTGAKVNISHYANNEELQAKLQSGVASYDLVVPSDYMVKLLIEEKLVQPIDKAKVPNMKHVDERFFKRSFDPENTHSVPYLWGTTGLGYDKQAVKGPVDSWAIMFDQKYGRKILMLDDMREAFAVALKLDGKSLNTTDPAALRKAADRLKQQKKLVRVYSTENYDTMLEEGDVVLSHGYNGQFGKLAAKDPAKFAYVIPKEGATQSMDAMCIPAKAKNVDLALAFMNFVHDPEINAAIVNGVNYASTNKEAKKFIKKEILENTAIYPTDEMLKNCEAMEDIGEALELMDKLWTEIKAQ